MAPLGPLAPPAELAPVLAGPSEEPSRPASLPFQRGPAAFLRPAGDLEAPVP